MATPRQSIVHHLRRESAARLAAEEVFSVCEPDGLVMQPALAKLIHGWGIAAEGNYRTGCDEIYEAFRAFASPGLVIMEAAGHMMLADALLMSGRAEEGLASLDEQLTRTKSGGAKFRERTLSLTWRTVAAYDWRDAN